MFIYVSGGLVIFKFDSAGLKFTFRYIPVRLVCVTNTIRYANVLH